MPGKRANEGAWLKQQIEAYVAERPTYKEYAKALGTILTAACARFAPLAVVSVRAKGVTSFAEKALRKKDKYDDPVHQLTDLGGARVVVQTQEEVERVCAFIRNRFLVDQANSLDCGERLATREFGYRAVHFVVQMPPRTPDILGVSVPGVGQRKAEIQVHTALQNAWAAIGHDRIYKSPFPVPPKLDRDGARVAALLEVSDRAFASLVEDLNRFTLNRGVALAPRDLLRELVDLSVLRAADPGAAGRADCALRQARLARVLGAWDLVRLLLKDVALGNDVPPSLADRVRLELGRAHCRETRLGTADYDAGYRLLAAVARPDEPASKPRTATRPEKELRSSAAVALAECGSLSGACSHDPEATYQLAMRCDPTNPYHLASYLRHEMAGRDAPASAEMMRPGLLRAIQTCYDHAAVEIELPHAFFTAGWFRLVLHEPTAALAEYARGVQVCLDPGKCVAGEVLDEERERFEALKGALPAEAGWVRRLLDIARALKQDPSHPTAACVVAFEALSAEADDETLEEWAKPLREAIASIEAEPAEDWVRWPDGVRSLAKRYRKRQQPASDALEGLATEPLPQVTPPVLIVAGGADPSIEHRMRQYREHIRQALTAFEGTVCSGGTEQGIPGLVGDVVREVRRQGNEQQTLIGYVPLHLPQDATEDDTYALVRTDATDFTPLEPLQNWIDLIAAGVDPADVRLLGINGGPVAASEYRLGLALGAQVAVVESSGRAVAELLPEMHWWQARNLLVLPDDPMAVRAFVMVGRRPHGLTAERQEAIARAIHARFLEDNRHRKEDATMVPFKYLSDDLKNSNREQAAYLVQVLRAAGYEVREAAGVSEAVTEFSDDRDVEFMAEMEHGRWIVERLRSGWHYDPQRDPEKKQSPYLVAWHVLPESVKRWDRDAVRSWPGILAHVDLAVVRLS